MLATVQCINDAAKSLVRVVREMGYKHFRMRSFGCKSKLNEKTNE